MINREKVIKGLECCSAMSGEECRKCPYHDECYGTDLPYGMPHLASDALQLLEEQEQEPIRPEQIFGGYSTAMPWVCGICYNPISYLASRCPHCGRRVNWS
jgi:hypothetical protein